MTHYNHKQQFYLQMTRFLLVNENFIISTWHDIFYTRGSSPFASLVHLLPK